MPAVTLEQRSQAFADNVQATLIGVLAGERRIVSRRMELADRYIVQPPAAGRPTAGSLCTSTASTSRT